MAQKKAKKKNLPAKIEKVDDQLVSTALQEIAGIYQDKTHEVVYAIGESLCRNFYGNDIKRIRKNKPAHGKSLNRFVSECSGKIDGLSRAWLYTSLNLLVDREDLQDSDDYKKLSVSHKHALLKVKGIEAKKELIGQIVTGELSVRNAVSVATKYLEENPEARVTKKKKKKKTLMQILKHAHLLKDPKYRHLKSKRHLDTLNEKQQEAIQKVLRVQVVMAHIEREELNESLTQISHVMSYFDRKKMAIEAQKDLEKKRKEIREKLIAEGNEHKIVEPTKNYIDI